MKIAIMQPYFFPYIGYFQLMKAVDFFVILDDVNFIKRGWINRNYLIFNKRKTLFTIPLAKASQTSLINEIGLAKDEYQEFKKNFLKTISQFYKNQNFFAEGLEILETALNIKNETLVDLTRHSLELLNAQLNLETKIMLSSDFNTGGCRREMRLIEICKQCGCDTYINLPGGKALYAAAMFSPFNIKLQFIQPQLSSYPVRGRTCEPGLSILDPIMCCGSGYVARELLPQFTLEDGK